jgi:hypothetical protein
MWNNVTEKLLNLQKIGAYLIAAIMSGAISNPGLSYQIQSQSSAARA